jgi:hypothetical protein
VFFIAVYLTPAVAFISFALLIMGSTLLKDVFYWDACPSNYPEPCGTDDDEKFCCATNSLKK